MSAWPHAESLNSFRYIPDRRHTVVYLVASPLDVRCHRRGSLTRDFGTDRQPIRLTSDSAGAPRSTLLSRGSCGAIILQCQHPDFAYLSILQSQSGSFLPREEQRCQRGPRPPATCKNGDTRSSLRSDDACGLAADPQGHGGRSNGCRATETSATSISWSTTGKRRIPPGDLHSGLRPGPGSHAHGPGSLSDAHCHRRTDPNPHRSANRDAQPDKHAHTRADLDPETTHEDSHAGPYGYANRDRRERSDLCYGGNGRQMLQTNVIENRHFAGWSRLAGRNNVHSPDVS